MKRQGCYESYRSRFLGYFSVNQDKIWNCIGSVRNEEKVWRAGPSYVFWIAMEGKEWNGVVLREVPFILVAD